jgi:hypothetical protein
MCGHDLEAEALGDQHHELAVGADQLAVFEPGHRHVAVERDVQLPGLHGLGRRGTRPGQRHHDGREPDRERTDAPDDRLFHHRLASLRLYCLPLIVCPAVGHVNARR